jgi:hypothetical protein
MNESFNEITDQNRPFEKEEMIVPWPVALGLTLITIFFLAIGIAVVFTIQPFFGSQVVSDVSFFELWALALTMNPSAPMIIILLLIAIFLVIVTIIGLVKAIIVLFFGDISLISGAALGGGISLPVAALLLFQSMLIPDYAVTEMTDLVWRILLFFLFGCFIGAIVGTPLTMLYGSIKGKASGQSAAVAGAVGTLIYVLLALFLIFSLSALYGLSLPTIN